MDNATVSNIQTVRDKTLLISLKCFAAYGAIASTELTSLERVKDTQCLVW
jgi:hypothetical protein